MTTFSKRILDSHFFFSSNSVYGLNGEVGKQDNVLCKFGSSQSKIKFWISSPCKHKQYMVSNQRFQSYIRFNSVLKQSNSVMKSPPVLNPCNLNDTSVVNTIFLGKLDM